MLGAPVWGCYRRGRGFFFRVYVADCQVEIVRRIFMKGVGLPELRNQVVPLMVFGIVAVGIAFLRFRKVQK